MSRRTAAILALALAGASLGCDSRRNQDANQSSVSAPVGPNWGARPGYVYGIELASHAKLPSGNAAFALGLKGELFLELIGKKADGLHLLARIDKPEMTLGDKVDPEAKRIANELTEPLLVVLEGGRVRDTRFSPSVRAVAISSWRSILSAVQLAEPSSPGATWLSEEYDSTGRYRAEYSRNPDGSVLRTKKSYLAMLGGPGAGSQGGQLSKPAQQKFQPDIVAATTRYLVKDAVLTTVDVKESVLTKLGDQSTLTVETTLALRVRPSVVPPKLALDYSAFLARSLHLPPDRVAPRPVGAADAEFDQLKMEGKKFSDIVAHFEQAAKETAQKQKAKQKQAAKSEDENALDPEELRETTGAFSSLAAFLRSDANARTEALAKIRAKSPAAMMLVSGFASAENAAAQQVLLELLADPTLPAAIRTRALMGVGRVARPEPSVAPAIAAVLGDPSVHRQALLSLGSLSRRLRDAGRDQEAAALRPPLRRELERATTPSDRALALRAISNSGDAELFSVVKPFLSDQAAAQERGAAAEALRHMNLPEVNRLLAERLIAESSPEAAQSILRAIRTRGAAPELIVAVSRVIESGPSPNVRQRAIELARSWLREHPELRSVLAAAAEKDPDPKVRSAAAKAI